MVLGIRLEATPVTLWHEILSHSVHVLSLCGGQPRKFQGSSIIADILGARFIVKTRSKYQNRRDFKAI